MGHFEASKSQEAEGKTKTKARKGKDEKEDKTLKREKPPHQVWWFFWVNFCYKTGDKLKFWPFFGPLIEVMAIYIYIYAVKLLSGPSLGFLNVIIWSKLGFLNVMIWSKFVF